MSSKQAAHEAIFGPINSRILQKTRIKSAAQRETRTPKQLERHVKGLSNHYRIRILFLLAQHGSMNLDQIVQALEGNVKTLSEHTRKLTIAGLIEKKYQGTMVFHSLSPYGKIFYRFLKEF
ncbi:winged helix-turn-helix transcriptional regulator [Acetobacteraceae bacterium]|nr:winged helix-turn-helix transcriptional regulator [Candidatus Parcubacteria bacterium]